MYHKYWIVGAVVMISMFAFRTAVNAVDTETGSTVSGTIVSAENGTLVLKGPDGVDLSYPVPSSTIIMLNGKSAKLTDLKHGFRAVVTITRSGGEEVVTKIEARSSPP